MIISSVCLYGLTALSLPCAFITVLFLLVPCVRCELWLMFNLIATDETSANRLDRDTYNNLKWDNKCDATALVPCSATNSKNDASNIKHSVDTEVWKVRRVRALAHMEKKVSKIITAHPTFWRLVQKIKFSHRKYFLVLYMRKTLAQTLRFMLLAETQFKQRYLRFKKSHFCYNINDSK